MATLPRIVWLTRDTSTEYGMMGNIKVFSIHAAGSRFRLDPRLPDRKGVQYLSEEFRSIAAAKKRAEEIRSEWILDLITPYEGQLARAS